MATQTAKATSEISAQVADMQSVTADTVTAIREISSTITQISEVSSAIAAAVEQQGAATMEIARNVQQSAQLSTQVASEVTEVSHGSSETSSASGQVLAAARIARWRKRSPEGRGREIPGNRARGLIGSSARSRHLCRANDRGQIGPASLTRFSCPRPMPPDGKAGDWL